LSCVKPTPRILDVLRCILHHQYGDAGARAFEDLLRRDLRVCIASTGRIRRVVVDGETAFTLRASDYVVIPHPALARLIHRYAPFPRYRIVVVSELANDVAEGYTVFARHVIQCDEYVRRGDEVLVVDESDNLLASARALLDCEAMITSLRGAAASIRFRCR